MEVEQHMTEAEKERAAIVAWLRGLHWTNVNYHAAKLLADAIQRGDHQEVKE